MRRVISVESAKLRHRPQIKHFSATCAAIGLILIAPKCQERSTRFYVRTKMMSWFCIHCQISIPGAKKLLKRLTVLESTQRELLKTIQRFENRSLNKENGTAIGSLKMTLHA